MYGVLNMTEHIGARPPHGRDTHEWTIDDNDIRSSELFRQMDHRLLTNLILVFAVSNAHFRKERIGACIGSQNNLVELIDDRAVNASCEVDRYAGLRQLSRHQRMENMKIETGFNNFYNIGDIGIDQVRNSDDAVRKRIGVAKRQKGLDRYPASLSRNSI